MIKKFTVSIGIPAYNEEANIKKLLSSLLRQKGNSFILKEIIVVSDSSTDNTVKEIQSVQDKRIKLIQNKKRLGQALSQGKIFKKFRGDIIILLNADVLPDSDFFIQNSIKPFYKNKKIGLVGIKLKLVKAETFFERIINFSASYKNNIFSSWKNGNNLLLCCGRARVFSASFANKLKWRSMVSEDAYSYLKCLSAGYLFVYNQDAKVFYKSPNSFTDHIRQSKRFLAGPDEMLNYFDAKFVKENYTVPILITLRETLKFFLRNPFYFGCYLVIYLYIKIRPNKDRYVNSIWTPSISSKSLSVR